jgi:hypothetical protein
LPDFWRRLFALERVPESKFFQLAEVAFPSLVFHTDLSFGRFDGSYLNLRDRVVTILTGLSDHFSEAYRQCDGLPHQVQAVMGSHHVELSPESSNTRGSARLMRLREVKYQDQTVCCEWHAKLEPNRNRIHFSAPSDQLGGRVLIGIFIEHLQT